MPEKASHRDIELNETELKIFSASFLLLGGIIQIDWCKWFTSRSILNEGESRRKKKSIEKFTTILHVH